MITHSTRATPRLDWLRSHLTLALQELQDGVDTGGIEVFCDPQELSDWNIWSFWVEWDTDSLELRLVPALDSDLKLIPGHERADSCIRLGYWSRWNPDVVTLESLTVGEVTSAVDEWQKLVLGDVWASRVITMLRHDLIPGGIEYDGLGLDLMRLIREIWRCRHNGARSVLPDNEFVTPLVEAVLSYYAADGMPSLQLRDCEAVWEVAHWLSADKDQSPSVRRFLSAAAELYAPTRA
jgi:hypothetical protein